MVKAPIFIDESGDLDVFETIEFAESHLEPMDVRNNEYTGYDSEGRLLRLVVINRFEISVQSAETIPTHQGELRTALTRFLSYFGMTEDWLSNASLADLVMKSMEYKTTCDSPLKQIGKGLGQMLHRLLGRQNR